MFWLSTAMPRWYALAVTVASVLVVGATAIGWTNYSLGRTSATERENDRRWCALLNTLDQAYSSSPPTSEVGRRVAAAIHTLRSDLEC